MRTLEIGKKRGGTGLALRFEVCAAIFIVTALGCGCSNLFNSGSTTPVPYTTYLYMTDTYNGHVYTYNPATHVGSSLPLLTTSTNAAGEIRFNKGIGYIAMGEGGIYYFDPSSTVPSATLIPGSSGVDAQYFAFYSPTQAYVSIGTSIASDTGEISTFNPSSPGSGLTQVAASAIKYMQEIIVGPDGMIYVAEYNDKTVLQINPVNNTVTNSYTTSALGTSGLVAGTYNGVSGVFVANTGGYTPSYAALPGSIDFIPSNGSIILNVAKPTGTVSPNFNPGRMVALSSGTLVATSETGHTWLIALSSGTVTEVLSNGNSFGSNLSIAYSNNLLYVPVGNYLTTPYSSQLYVFDANGNQQSYSPVTVPMETGDLIANIAFYQD
jgi:hypothetical protein